MILRPVVEGHGDATAVPELVRRILHEKLQRYDVRVLPGYRIPRKTLVSGPVDNRLRSALESERGTSGVLAVFDADDDCAIELARRFAPNPRVRIAVAVREFEAWFLADSDDPEIVARAELVRGAKELLAKTRLAEYAERRDATRLVHTLDLDRVERNSRSFRHLVKVVGELVQGSD